MTGYYSKSITINELVRKVRVKLLETLVQSQLDLDGINVSLATSGTNGGGERLWFKCPKCNRRCGKLVESSSGYLCIRCT